MSWLTTINKNILPLICPNAPKHYRALNPHKLNESLGDFCFDHWREQLARLRCTVDFTVSKTRKQLEVIGELDDEKLKMDLMILFDRNNSDPRGELIAAIAHEYIHIDQFRVDPNKHYYRRVKREIGDAVADYLSLVGELNAFAHDAFIEYNTTGDLRSPSRCRYDGLDDRVRKQFDNQMYRWEKRYHDFGVKPAFLL